jgi:myo-inositol catabolism protein IolC
LQLRILRAATPNFLEAIRSMTHDHSSVAVFDANGPVEVAIRSSAAMAFLALQGAVVISRFGAVAVAGALASIGVPHDRVLRYEQKLRAETLSELRNTRIEADIWKVEVRDSQDYCERIVVMGQHNEHTSVDCIVLGRGENEQHVRVWLAAAATSTAGMLGFMGFTVGRTTFWEPLLALRNKNITRKAAVAEVARRYRQWVDIFELGKTAADFSARASVTGLARPLKG